MAYTTPEQQAWLNAQKAGSAKNPADLQAMDPGLAMQAASIAFGNTAPKVDLRGQPGSGVGSTGAPAASQTWAGTHPVGWDKPPAPPPAAPSFSGAPAATSGPSGFKSFSGENGGAQRYTGKPIPTVGSQPQGAFVPQIGGGGSFASQGAAQQSGYVPSPISTATLGSYAPQIAVPQYTATPYGGSTSVGTQINPNDSLRSQQFLPGSTQNAYDQQAIAALNAVQGANTQNQYDAQAAGMYGNANMPTEFSPMVGESRDMIMQRLRDLSGPDRTQLAQEAYDIFRQQSEPAYQQDLRGVGQKAAALGRVGAGMTTNDLTGVLGQREQQQNLLKRSLINDAGQQTLQDRLNTLNATMGGSSTLEGQDYGRQSAAANLAMGKAAGFAGLGQNQYNREYNNQSLGMDKARMLGDMGSEEFNRGQQNYNQNANERAYQDYLARTALEDRIRQQEMQQRQAADEWERQNRANILAAQIAGQQNTQYPGIAQPQGDSFGAGQYAGTGTPTYTTGGGYAPQIATEPAWQPPPSMFDTGLGYQDPNNWAGGPATPPSIFEGQGLGMQPNGGFTISPFARMKFGLE